MTDTSTEVIDAISDAINRELGGIISHDQDVSHLLRALAAERDALRAENEAFKAGILALARDRYIGKTPPEQPLSDGAGRAGKP